MHYKLLIQSLLGGNHLLVFYYKCILKVCQCKIERSQYNPYDPRHHATIFYAVYWLLAVDGSLMLFDPYGMIGWGAGRMPPLNPLLKEGTIGSKIKGGC